MVKKKRLLAITATCLLFLFLLGNRTLANSTPVYLERYPALSIAPMEDAPIRVEREVLTVEVDEKSCHRALVTANYTLTNTSSEPQTIPLVFPYISDRFGDFAPEIYFAGEAVDFKVLGAGRVTVRDYMAEPEEFRRQVDIDRIIANLNKAPYEPVHFSPTEAVTLYKVTFGPPVKRRCRLSFTLDPDQTRVLAFGFTGFELDKDGRAQVSNYINNNEVGKAGYLLVLGRDTLGEVKCEAGDRIERSEVIVRDFLAQMIADREHVPQNWEEDFYSLLLQEIDRFYGKGQLVFSYDMLIDNVYTYNNIFALLYVLEFAPGGTYDLQVSFPVRATIDRRESVDYVNTFAYLLHPARNFQEFGGIDIHICLNSHCPYIIASSIELKEEGNGVYTASLDKLPSADLVFSTYPREKITFLDRMRARFMPRGYGGQLLAVFILLLTMLIFGLRGRKGK